MRTLLALALLAATALSALADGRTTRGGEPICTKRQALAGFVADLRARRADALGATPGCIAAQPGLVLVALGRAGTVGGAPVTRIRALSFADREFFTGFTTAPF